MKNRIKLVLVLMTSVAVLCTACGSKAGTTDATDADTADVIESEENDVDEVPKDDTTEVAEAVDDDSWKQAYLDFLNDELPNIVQDEDLDAWQYGFIYVNDDDIPELVISSGYEAAGNIIATVIDGTVEYMNTARLNFYYIERGNVIDNADGHMGYYYDDIYKIGDTGFESVASGNYNMVMNEDETDFVPDEFEYYIGEDEVSEDEYYAMVEKYTPHDEKISWAAGTTLSNMTSYLEGDVYADYRAAYKDLISMGIEGSGGEMLYGYALNDRAEGRDPMMLAVGDEEFCWISYDDGLVCVGPTWYFTPDSETIFVYTDSGEIHNFTHYESSNYSSTSIYWMKDGSLLSKYYSCEVVSDWDGNPILDDEGNQQYKYLLNGYEISDEEYNSELAIYDEVFKYELVPANADETYTTYYDRYGMEDVLKAFG